MNDQLIDKLSHSYMFRHYRVILRELLINTLPSYTSISKTTCVTCRNIQECDNLSINCAFVGHSTK